VTVELTSAIRPTVVHHVVPPVPTTAPNTVASHPSKPLTASAGPNLTGRTAPHLAKPAVRPGTVSTAAPPMAKVGQASTNADASFGCGAAVSYLATHAAPGFRVECPGYALGHQAMTCIDVPGVCPGTHLIAIDVPCAAAYMNEASNSWVLEGLRHAPIDPYGYCH
jgi:hypothetical protein